MFLSLVSAKRIDLLSRRDPESLVCPLDGTDHSLSELESRHSMVEALKPTVTRKLVLVRHGQYNTEGEEDKEKVRSSDTKRMDDGEKTDEIFDWLLDQHSATTEKTSKTVG